MPRGNVSLPPSQSPWIPRKPDIVISASRNVYVNSTRIMYHLLYCLRMTAIHEPHSPEPKYRQVYAALRREIQSGQWKGGERLPSEADLVRQFGASRITIGRAVRDLQAAGFVERRAGSGTFVKRPAVAAGMSF